MVDAQQVGCPRCPGTVEPAGADGWRCDVHGAVDPLWRPARTSYAALVDHLERTDGFPTYLPWPLGPGWSVTDFAAVTGAGTRATLTCVSGTSALDGPVDVIVVSEETGTGLGARVAGLDSGTDGAPFAGPHAEPAEVKVRLESYPVGLWPVSISATESEWDRSVLAGEAEGRWLWLMLRPASAILLLRDEWILRDVSVTGPQLVTLPFGGPAPPW